MGSHIIEKNITIDQPVPRTVRVRIQGNGASITDPAFSVGNKEYPEVKVRISELSIMALGILGFPDEKIAEGRRVRPGTLVIQRRRLLNMLRIRYNLQHLSPRQAVEILQERGFFEEKFIIDLNTAINPNLNNSADVSDS